MADRKRDRSDDRPDNRRQRKESWQPGDEVPLTPLEGDVSDGDDSVDTLGEAETGYVLMDGDTDDEDRPMDAEELDDFLTVGTNVDGVMDAIDDFSSDQDVLDDFEERQRLNNGSDQLLDKLKQHHSQKPDLAGGDIDAAWEDTNQSGDESVGGTVTTPGKNVVDDLGEAVGVEYNDFEPLDTYSKLQSRDTERWELDPESTEDLDEGLEDELDLEIEDELEALDELDEEELDEDLEELDELDEHAEAELEEDLDDYYDDEEDLDDLYDDFDEDEDDDD